MGLSINIELSDNDLEHFQSVLKRADVAAGALDPHQITDSARKLLADATAAKVPDFIAERLNKLESLITMVHDVGWALPAAECRGTDRRRADAGDASWK